LLIVSQLREKMVDTTIGVDIWNNLEYVAVLLEAIEAMRLKREAKRGATMRPASQVRHAGNARCAP